MAFRRGDSRCVWQLQSLSATSPSWASRPFSVPVIALIFRLNLPAIQLVQAAMAPTQLLLLIPFVRLGEWMLRVPPQIVSIEGTFALLSLGIWQAVVLLRDAIFHAAFAWGVTAPLCIYLLQRLLTPVFERMAAQIRRQP
jgi:hypothetical protein